MVELEAELLIAPVKEKAQGASARSSIVDYLGNKAVVFTKVQLVPDADFASGIHQNVPKAALRIEFAKQEYLDERTGLLFVSPHSCREHFGIVDNQEVAGLKKIG